MLTAGSEAPAALHAEASAPRAPAQCRALAERNLGLIVHMLKRLGLARHAEWADLFQAGAIGMMEAAARWDPERGSFSTCACWGIRSAVMRELARLDLIRVKAGRLTREERAELRAKLRPQQWPGQHRHGSQDLERHAVEKVAGPEGAADDVRAEQARREAVARLLAVLHPRQAEVIRRRLAGQTLDEVGLALGISRERVRQVEAKARARMRLHRHLVAGLID